MKILVLIFVRLKAVTDLKKSLYTPLGVVDDILFWTPTLEFLDSSLYQFWRRQAFTLGNSPKLFDTPWKFQGQKRRNGNSTWDFLEHSWKFHFFFNWHLEFLHGNRITSTLPVWIFSGIAQWHFSFCFTTFDFMILNLKYRPSYSFFVHFFLRGGVWKMAYFSPKIVPLMLLVTEYLPKKKLKKDIFSLHMLVSWSVIWKQRQEKNLASDQNMEAFYISLEDIGK